MNFRFAEVDGKTESWLLSQGAVERVGEVNVVGGQLVREGRILSSVVHIVALNTLVENAKPAPEDRLAIPEDIVSEANSRFRVSYLFSTLPRGNPLTPASSIPFR